MPLKIPRDKILSENSHPLPPVLPARSDDLDLHGYFLNFRTKKKGNVPKSEHIKIPNMHEPIIDINLWNTVQKLRQTRSKASSGKDGKKHPLSGKVYCEKCGSKMYKCKSGGISYFRCYRASSTGECDNHKRIRLSLIHI